MNIVIQILVLLYFFVSPVLAEDNKVEPIKVGDVFKPYKLEDAHHKKHTLKPETKLVLISFEMELSKGIHGWLANKEPDFLNKNKAEYVADITEMPGIITWLFARPKMQKYPFTILLADDEKFAPSFPREEEKILAIELDDNKVVKNLSFYKDMDAVSAAYFSANTLPVPEPSKATESK